MPQDLYSGSPAPDENPVSSTYRPTRSRKATSVLVGVMICYLFMYTGRQAFGFAIPGIEADLGLSKQSLGWVSAAMLWAYALGQFVNGGLVDRFGGRRGMLIGAVGSTLANWVTSFGTGLVTLLLPWAANGYLQAFGWPSGSRLLSDSFVAKQRGRAFGFYTFSAASASVVAFVASILLVDVFSLNWRWLFRMPVLLMIVGGATVWLLTRRPQDEPTAPAPAVSAPPALASTVPEGAGTLRGYFSVLRTVKIWAVGLCIGFLNVGRYGLLIWAPVHFVLEGTVWTAVALPLGMAVGTLSNGWVSDKIFGARRSSAIMTYMTVGAIVSIVLWILPPATLLAIPLLFVAGLLVYGPAASVWALVPDLVGPQLTGTATGVLNTFAYGFAGLAEPAVGYLIDVTGQAGLVFAIVATACALSAGSALLIRM
ncbi:MFS transporter [Amycolatopsis sp. A1MSW2902]|uniref:MFS transporter n=1 Tax=Amycolatopsis sp. A1MSW2902 TaxID=687413 RepID=UPI00307D76E7